MRGATAGIGALFTCIVGCGGATPPPAAPAAPPPASAESPGSIASGSTAAPPPAASRPGPASAAPSSAPAVAGEAWVDPNEKSGPIEMTPLFDKKKSKSTFPRKTADDRECWSTLAISGEHEKDYETLVAACGTPTGLAEYARPVLGKLHHKHDPRDVYTLKLLGGYCYRYFAVADSGIADLDVLIEKPGGALVGDDKTSSPVAIIESDQPWCLDEDQRLEFHVEVDGPGGGGYAFGVWARPRK